MLRKKKGDFTGWVGYTLSRSQRQFAEINNGEWFSARQDRIHDISVVLMYSITERLKASMSWVYYTGDAATFPSGKYEMDGAVYNYFTERNGNRMPDYHRLDAGVTLYGKEFKTSVDPDSGEEIKTKKRFQSNWNFSVYNAYARENAYQINFRDSETNPGQTEAVQLSLFKIIPSITYSFTNLLTCFFPSPPCFDMLCTDMKYDPADKSPIELAITFLPAGMVSRNNVRNCLPRIISTTMDVLADVDRGRDGVCLLALYEQSPPCVVSRCKKK